MLTKQWSKHTESCIRKAGTLDSTRWNLRTLAKLFAIPAATSGKPDGRALAEIVSEVDSAISNLWRVVAMPLSRAALSAMSRLVIALGLFVLVHGAIGSKSAGIACAQQSESDLQTSVPSALTYERDVRPILKAMCFHCHGEEPELAGGLDVRLVRLLVAGGDSGAALKHGDVAASLVWQRIESDEMPEGSKKLAAKEKRIIRSWIEQGARTARTEPENGKSRPTGLDVWLSPVDAATGAGTQTIVAGHVARASPPQVWCTKT